ncbi:MAG TPA: triphosphoribosyl-dephospho-CoA synthase [Methylomirabilota bacterium]|jgi:triphosphoribosyl-dephospho-CoA synthase
MTAQARDTVALAATLACVLEASADKVGNVTPTRSFADMRFTHFVDSAAVLGPAIAQARPGQVGRAIWRAVAAARRVVPINTHLGVALLLAPIAAAWMARPRGRLRSQVARVLAGLGTDDARWAYRAIRLAQPGGLGRSEDADVRRPPTVTLGQAMALAAHRDSIAAEYTRDFALTFTVVLPALRRAIRRGLGLLEAIAHAHLELIAAVPDTLIARKRGWAAAQAVSARARAVLRRGGWHTRAGRSAAARLDHFLRRDGNRLNPGTSADLIAASLFVWLLDAGPGMPGR